jgi:lysophospholipase L1-like esterase
LPGGRGAGRPGAPSRRRRARRTLVAVGALALALLAAEVAWRLLRTRGFGPTTNPAYVERDDVLGWRYRPGAQVRHRTDEFDVAIAIGPHGFRDATPAPPASSGSRPIVTLGDSLTFGWGVAEREAFPAVLEELTGVAVQNLGVSGYGTDQELLLFARAGADPPPRAVVVMVCGNDVEEVARRRAYGRAKPWFPGPGFTPAEAEPPAREPWIVRRSHLARSLAKALAARSEAPLGPADVAAARAKVAGLLAELARLAAAGGGELLVAHEGEAWLAESLMAAGIPAVDLAPALAAANAGGPVRFARDPHWTARGHAAVAAAIARRLEEVGALR